MKSKTMRQEYKESFCNEAHRKTWFAIIICIALSTFVFAQQDEEPAESASEKVTGPFLGQSLNWIIGKWTGTGQQRGVTFTSELDVSSVLSETSLLIKRISSGGYEEAMLLGFDNTSKKNVATLYDNRYHTGLFTCTTGQNQLNCSQVSSDPKYASKRSFSLASDGTLIFTIQRKDPQMTLQKVLEVSFKKS
jgi:hypothetical protein